MPTFLRIRKEETAEEITLEETEVMTMTEAAREMEVTLSAIHQAIRRGDFTEIIDPSARFHQRRRLLLRKEVETAVEKR